jgi:hypothetical protein
MSEAIADLLSHTHAPCLGLHSGPNLVFDLLEAASYVDSVATSPTAARMFLAMRMMLKVGQMFTGEPRTRDDPWQNARRINTIYKHQKD